MKEKKLTHKLIEFSDDLIEFSGLPQKEDFYRIQDIYLEFLGNYHRRQHAPLRRGFFYLIPTKQFFKRTPKEKYYDEKIDIENNKNRGRKLDTRIKDRDNELMVIVKRALENKTTEEFKTIFTNLHDYNNCRRLIEKGGSLSFNLFKKIVQGLDFRYNIEIYVDEKKAKK